MSNTTRHLAEPRPRPGRHRPDRHAPKDRRAPGVRRGLAGLGLAGMITALAVAWPADAAAGPQPGSPRPGTPTKTRIAVVPPVPNGLPNAIEDLAGYVPQTSCEPAAKPGVLALGRLLTATYPNTGYATSRACGTETIASEHADGRALDWQVSARNSAQAGFADHLIGWLFASDGQGRPFANARRLGVMYIIWDDQIWGAYSPLVGWQPYSTCAAHQETASDLVCHRDRLHLSLSWAGAMGRTSFWTRTVADVDYGPCRPRDLNWAPAYTARNATPCPSYRPVTAPAKAGATGIALVRFSGATVGPGSTGPVVSAVQKSLGVTADGSYGPVTAAAVIGLQRHHTVTASGVMDAATWRVLIADTVTGLAAQPIPVPVKPRANSPLTRYRGTVLQYGSRGAAVLALQKRLSVSTSGWFGPATRAKVISFQTSAGLPATGIVTTATWKALGA